MLPWPLRPRGPSRVTRMPKGPRGEKRPADVIGNAVHVMRIAPGEIGDDPSLADEAKAVVRRAGRIGGRARN